MALDVMRPVRLDDFDQVLALAQQADAGMTTLPSDEEALRPRIEFAAESFESGASEPGGEVYFLVLERDGEIIGTSAVFSAIGLDHGFVNYRINRTVHVSKQLRKRIERRLLVPTHDFTGCSEVGSLFLAPAARGGGTGTFLSRVRYLFIADHRDLIADPVCAELRGWRDANGEYPFWDALGKPFFDMEFEAADIASSAMGIQFISDMMPRHPIYVALLPKAARDVLGRPHDNGAPALKLLLNEGFVDHGYIDVFDGGPVLDAKIDEIKTVSESRVFTARAGDAGGETMMVSSGRLTDFRAVRCAARRDGDDLFMAGDAFDGLDISPGETVRAVTWG